MNWQPMNTAPTDGTRILAVDINAHTPGVDIVYFSDFWKPGDPDMWDKCANLGFKEWYDSLTHWMPLPALPLPTTTEPPR